MGLSEEVNMAGYARRRRGDGLFTCQLITHAYVSVCAYDQSGAAWVR